MSAALSFALPAAAQQPTTPQANQLTGMVFNKQGDPLVGAYVRVKQGKKTWTVQTDETGKYVINLPAGQSTAGLSVSVSYIGMQRQVKGTKAGVMHYDFMLEDNSKSLGEAVVTGYGTISTREKTSSITSLKMDEILMPGMTSLEQALEGRVPTWCSCRTPVKSVRRRACAFAVRRPLSAIENRFWVLDGYPLVGSCRCDQRTAQRPRLH